jgi:hypothetical protein
MSISLAEDVLLRVTQYIGAHVSFNYGHWSLKFGGGVPQQYIHVV